MRDIPKQILDRCTFKKQVDGTEQIHKIKPIADCVCGRVLESTRYVRIRRTVEPHPHYREYCITCKLVSVLDHNDWKSANELNAEMRSKNTSLTEKD
jgi:hypothetical protein